MDLHHDQRIGLTVPRYQRHQHIFFMSPAGIKTIPEDRTATYAQVVVDFWPQKEDRNCVRITVGGNLINYPREVATHTADMVTS
jgi:hypothetical protein